MPLPGPFAPARSAVAGRVRDSYLGMLCDFDEFAAYGFSLNSGLKVLLLSEGEAGEHGEQDGKMHEVSAAPCRSPAAAARSPRRHDAAQIFEAVVKVLVDSRSNPMAALAGPGDALAAKLEKKVRCPTGSCLGALIHPRPARQVADVIHALSQPATAR